MQPPAHQPGVLPVWLRERGADVVLAGGMGRRAAELMESLGIEVFVGVQASKPRAAVEAYLAGTLQSGGSLCGGGGHCSH